jgi:hypothetical protein
MKIGQPKLSERKSEAPRPPRQDGAGTAGPVDKAHGPEYVEWASRARSGEQNASKGSFVHIVPLPARRQAGTPPIPLRRGEARLGQQNLDAYEWDRRRAAWPMLPIP